MVVISVPLTTGSGVNDVFIAENNHYSIIATTGGIEVINLFKGAVVSSGIIPGGFQPLCVAAEWQTSSGLIYVGTSGGGIFSTKYHPARGDPFSNLNGFISQRYSTTTTPSISSDIVHDLDVLPGKILVATATGIDFIYNEHQRSTRFLVAGSRDTRLTSDGLTGYWTTASSIEVNYNLISSIGGGIIGVDFDYSVTSIPPIPAAPPTDIAITQSSPRALAFATPSGLRIIEEKPGNESSSQIKTFTDPDNSADPFVSADFSPNASFSSGFVYATTTGVARIFHLLNVTLSGTHPQVFTAQFDDAFAGASRDQLLASGTQGIVRTTSVLT